MDKCSIPETLLDDIKNEECVLFLGAGASTEGSLYFGKSLVDMLAEKCKYLTSSPKNLPKVAQYFCDIMDGGFKGRLLREIREYLDQYMEIAEAYRVATDVHRLVAKIGFFQIIITTNWDVFTERELNVLPIVRDADLVYWNSNKRQVIKLHGCISQPETTVVTEDDYRDFQEKRTDCPISNKLKDLMATKTFLFVGYSLKDESFQILQENVLSRMGKLARTSYAVLPQPTNALVQKWKKKGIRVIPGNALAFLRDLHNHFVEEGIYFEDDLLFALSELDSQIIKIQLSMNQEDSTELLSAMYQDGLKHELDEIHYGITRGKPRSFFEDRLLHFNARVDYWTRHNEPTEISYNKGRAELLLWAFRLGSSRKEKLGFYINNSFEPIDETEFRKIQNAQKANSQQPTAKSQNSAHSFYIAEMWNSAPQGRLFSLVCARSGSTTRLLSFWEFFVDIVFFLSRIALKLMFLTNIRSLFFLCSKFSHCFSIPSCRSLKGIPIN